MVADRRSRRRGRGSLQSYETKAGERWRWQLYAPIDPDDPDGEMRRIGGAGFRTADDADDALRAALKKINEQEVVGSANAPTIEKYADQWLAGLHLENSTIYGYEKIVRNHVKPYLGKIRINKLTATRLARHYRELSESGRRDSGHAGEPLSANSVNKIHIVIGAILDAAIDDGHISQNPARRRRTVKAPTGKQIRAQQAEVPVWTAGELKRFLEWDRDVLDDELYSLWRVIAHTGMRRSESLALRWSDIDLTNHRISIRRAADVTQRNVVKSTKANGARSVDIDPETVDVLKAWKALRGSIALDLARPGAYLFGNMAGEMRSPNEVGARWSYRVKKAREHFGADNLKPLTIKGLRHTHATLLLEIGENPKIVQERLGHSNISTTMNIYSHVTPTMQRNAVDRLAALFRDA